ncbi:hypothetical protein Acsp04_58870 [Actinomadura sp. NBRC 104425]|uniref:hypothetical protein n=1 Tax=Actinomadura sp. NBRC 104425 TaxID=3032204 RepID=UPI00249FF503|nr:hypothetical protein [Actinomadura sp. NBRC 104425]GLZ15652.1 hypothetical protein Acsp04_58870 [Actinomadura sp. NBRC 104425]
MAEIEELARIPFRGSLQAQFEMYGRELYTIARAWAHELEMAASDAEAAMTELHGNPWLLGLDAKIKARKVAKRIKRAQEMADGLAQEAQRFYKSYLKQFVEASRGVR